MGISWKFCGFIALKVIPFALSLEFIAHA